MSRKKIDWKELPDGYDKYKAYIKSPEWEEVRKVVLERFDYHCACCGRKIDETELYIHHNSYEYLYHELNHLDCVIPVCKTDHCCLHRNKANWCRFKRPK